MQKPPMFKSLILATNFVQKPYPLASTRIVLKYRSGHGTMKSLPTPGEGGLHTRVSQKYSFLCSIDCDKDE